MRLFGWLAGHQCRAGRSCSGTCPGAYSTCRSPGTVWLGSMSTYLAVASGISRGIRPAAELAGGLSLALILAEPVLGAHSEQPLASSWVRLAVQNPPSPPSRPCPPSAEWRSGPVRSLASRAARRPQTSANHRRVGPDGRAGAGRRAGWPEPAQPVSTGAAASQNLTIPCGDSIPALFPRLPSRGNPRVINLLS
jgi:hypothetical protein